MSAPPRLADDVARQLQIDRPLVAQRGVQHAVDLRAGGVGIFQRRMGHGDLREDAPLRVELAHLVVEQGIALALIHPRRAADDHDRRFFRKRPGDRVHHFQPAHAIRHAHRAQPADARIGIRREARALFVACRDRLERALPELLVKAEDVIARDAKDVADAVRREPFDEVAADGHGRKDAG